MAKKENAVDGVEGGAEGGARGGRSIVLENGEKRVDYIRRRFAEGATRSEIAKELGVRYQIVFAATKAPKAPAEETAAEAPAEE